VLAVSLATVRRTTNVIFPLFQLQDVYSVLFEDVSQRLLEAEDELRQHEHCPSRSLFDDGKRPGAYIGIVGCEVVAAIVMLIQHVLKLRFS